VLPELNKIVPKNKDQYYNFAALANYLCISDGRPALNEPLSSISKFVLTSRGQNSN
jgi:hypothetical protein